MAGISDNRGKSPLDSERRKQARETSRSEENNGARIDKLEARLDRLSLITEALWEISSTTMQITDEDLVNLISKVISTRDERRTQKAICTNCDMQVPTTMEKCMYCGSELSRTSIKSPFD